MLCRERIRLVLGNCLIPYGSHNELIAVASERETSEGRNRWTDGGNGYKGGSCL
jgi:hypothetical protein